MDLSYLAPLLLLLSDLVGSRPSAMVALAGGGGVSGVVAVAGGGLLDDYHRTFTPAPQTAQNLRNRGPCFSPPH